MRYPLASSLIPIARIRSLNSLVVNFKKTEGLELGAVDKLLVGIFVDCDGEEGGDDSPHSTPTILFTFALLSNRN